MDISYSGISKMTSISAFASIILASSLFHECSSLSSSSFATLTLSTSYPTAAANGVPSGVPGIFWSQRRDLLSGTGTAGASTASQSTASADTAPFSSVAGSTSHDFSSSASVNLGSVGSLISPSQATVLVGTVRSQVVSETFVPVTHSDQNTLQSTTTTLLPNGQNNPVPMSIGPGSIAWTPLTQSSKALTLPPPTNPPSIPGVTSSPALDYPAFSTTTSSSPTAQLPIITTSYDPQPQVVSTLDRKITSNTAVRTSDDKHPAGLYPVIKGGPHCFFCPPGIDGGGLVLFGMQLPGVRISGNFKGSIC